MSKRIFISSVMNDFGPQRQAVKAAIESLRQTPVRAEDFGAQPTSSQTACLEGVRSSDLYIGIFGKRYGFVAPTSGIGATEEEFQEARNRGLPILCFVQNGAKDPQQVAFLERVKDYETGYFVCSFDTPEELQLAVVRAINDQVGQPGVANLQPAAAKSVLDRYRWGSRRSDQSGTWLGGVLVPARSGDAFLDVLDFDKKKYQDELLQPAVFGAGSLFNLDVGGVQRSEVNDSLVFRQESNRSVLTTHLEIHADATLIYGALVEREQSSFSGAGAWVIEEVKVEQQLQAFLAFAGQFYQKLSRGDLITSLFFGSSLTGIEHRSFGYAPPQNRGGFTVPMHNLANPLNIPDLPLRVTRADVTTPDILARRMVDHIARVFRNAKAYQPANRVARPW